MTLKITLLVWESIVTSNGSVSCLIGHDERFQPLMISTSIGVFFSTKANLYCHTNYFSIRHVDVPQSRCSQASIVISLLHLTMIGIKRHGIGSKNRIGPFSLHDASTSSLTVPIEIGHVHFLTFLIVD